MIGDNTTTTKHITCDDDTRATLNDLVGRRLRRVLALQFGSVGPYRPVLLSFEGGYWVRLLVNDVTIAWKFEVFVISARLDTEPKDVNGWDQFTFNDFVVTETHILSRDEWVQGFDGPPPPTLGRDPVAQHFAPAGKGPRDMGAVTVDTGVRLVSTNHAELTIDADTFPMNMSLNYRAWSYGPKYTEPD